MSTALGHSPEGACWVWPGPGPHSERGRRPAGPEPGPGQEPQLSAGHSGSPSQM